MTTLSRKIHKYERPFYYVVTGVIALSFFVWTAPFSDSPTDQSVGSIAGKPVTRAELDAMRYSVDLLALLDGFSRSPTLSASFARNRWLSTLIQVRSALRDPQMRGFYLQYLGLGELGDLGSHEVLEAQSWKWIAYLRAAEQAGFTVTPGEVTRFIRSIVGVPENAPFPRDYYIQAIQSSRGLGVPVAQFEQTVRKYLLAAKYFDAVGSAASVTGQELLDAYLEEYREVELAWMGFEPKDFAAAAPEPSREAVARYFRDKRAQFRLPAKVCVEVLLAEPTKLLDGIEAPSEPDIRTRYEANRDRDYRNPDGGKDGKPKHKPLEEVREAIVKDLKQERASLKASEILQKALLEIGTLEAKQGQDASVRLDFAALAKQFDVTRLETGYVEAGRVEDAEAVFGAFREPRDREAFSRKIFTDMKEGEVMRGELRPLPTDKGWIIYRLLQRKPARTPAQLTAEVEDDILRRLRKEALDKTAVETASEWKKAIDADGLEKTETARGKTFHRPPATRAGNPLPDPDGDHGNLADGGQIIEAAFSLRKADQVGKARLLDAGTGRTKYVVVLLKALEAKMDDFEKQKPWLRERLLMNGFQNGVTVPGKRQVLIDARRAEIEKGIVREDVEKKPAPGAAESRPAPTSNAAPPAGPAPENKTAPPPPAAGAAGTESKESPPPPAAK